MRLKSLIGMACLCTAIATPSTADTWVHPGVLNSKASLDKIPQFSSLVNPSAFSAYNAYRSQYTDTSAQFGSNYQHKAYATVYARTDSCSGESLSEKAFESDAFAAYYNAIRWVRDGNVEAAAKAKAILGSWAETFDDIVLDPCPENYYRQVRNEVVWFIPIWINTAEILRNYKRPNEATAGWNASAQVKFTGFMDKLWSKVDPTEYNVNPSGSGMNNITASANMAGMAYWVWKGGENLDKFSVHRDNIRALINVMIQNSNGRVREFERETNGDCVHPQYSMMAFLQAGWIEKNQLNQTTIFDTTGGQGTTPRLLKGLRYVADRFNGMPLADDASTPEWDESQWDCTNDRLRDGYYQLALRYYGSGQIQALTQAYQSEMNSPEDPQEAKPDIPGMFTNIQRVTHGSQ